MKLSLPIPNLVLLKRSLLLDNRNIVTYVFRFLLVGGILFVLIEFQQSYQNTQMISAIGRKFLMFVTNINLAIITLAGLSFYSSAVTEEKEDQTLPLLMMTGMSPFNFLAGKFFSRLTAGGILLLAQVPFTVLAVAFGGVSIFQIINVYIALGAYLVFLCGLAILTSTIAPTNKVASFLTLLGLIIFYGGHAIFYVVLNILYNLLIRNCSWKNHFYFREWNYIQPFYRVWEICQTGFAGSLLGIQFWSNLFLGLGFFVLALKFFYRYTRKFPGRLTFKTAKVIKKKKFQEFFMPKRTWNNAIAWKEFHFGMGGKWALWLRIFFYTTMGLSFLAFTHRSNYFRESYYRDVSYFVVSTGLMALAVELTSIASNIYSQELKNQTFSSIAILPCSIANLAYRKILGTLPMLVPVVIYILFGFFFHLDNWFVRTSPDGKRIFFAIVFFLFFLHLVTWLSLRIKYGSWVLAIIIFIVSVFVLDNYILECLGVSNDTEGNIAISIYVISIFVLHFDIGKKLNKLAAR